MNNINIEQDIDDAAKRLQIPEQMLGRELLMPFAPNSSGARCLMFSSQLEQRMTLLHGEVPVISTGFETEFGKKSSTFTTMDQDAEVLAIISKYNDFPKLFYYMIIKKADNTIDVITRIAYTHITETYGFLFDNTFLDNLKIGDTIFKDQVIHKSQCFDNDNNRTDGINLRTAYLSCSNNTEDAIIISESAAQKFTSPLLKKVNITINDNDILLNLYGDEDHYKIIPGIGCDIKNCVLAAMRRENKDESLFTQTYDRLRSLLMSDEKFLVRGKVIDIDVYCNNIESMNSSIYNEQLIYYWNEKLRCAKNVVDIVDNLVNNGYTQIGYELQKLYTISKKTLQGMKFSKVKPFSNISIDITVLEELPLKVGDKITNRYGGKGVIGQIVPDDKMPRTETGDIVELIYNQATGTNRLNLSQFFEQEINHYSEKLIQWLVTSYCSTADESYGGAHDAIKYVLDFIRILNPEQAEYYEERFSNLSDDDAIMFLNTLASDKGIMLSLSPIKNNATIDTIEKIIDTFPFLVKHPPKLFAYMIGSNGQPRYVECARPVIVGYEYIYRLKQYAEEKFSTTSLSSTNLRGENSRSKSASQFRDMYARTPIRFGEMETMSSAHLGTDAVVFMLMLNSTSPAARRRTEELLTNSDINVDVKLGEKDSSRNVETLNAYLKTMGIKLEFSKKRKLKSLYTQILYDMPIRKPLYKIWDEDSLINKKTGKRYTLEELDKEYPVKFLPKLYTFEEDITNDADYDDTLKLLARRSEENEKRILETFKSKKKKSKK